MAVPVIMPRQGQSVESCIIAKWYKKKGEKVQAGDVLFTYETDKATFDEEAKADGMLLEVFFAEGDDVPVLTNVCVIGSQGENTDVFRPGSGEGTEGTQPDGDTLMDRQFAATETAAEKNMEVKVGGQAAGIIQTDTSCEGIIKISPRARNLADKTGIDYRHACGTGPYGRIIERDITALQESGPVATPAAMEACMKASVQFAVPGTGIGGRIITEDLKNAQTARESSATAASQRVKEEEQLDYVEIKLTNIRKVIAKAMHHSISTTAQLTLNSSFDATEILEFRKKLKENKDKLGLENITINDIILYAVSRTILRHRELNAHFLEDRMLVFNNVNLGIAIDTDRGLMVPTLFNANLKSLNSISAEVKGLVEQCQKGTISPDALKGGTFTITNLGTLDIESFTPVLNPPQTGILGVNNITQRVREYNGEYIYYPAMGLSLTFDHRALDGAPAARFLKDLKTNLENFSALLAV